MLFSEPQVIWVNKLFNIFFDSFCVVRYVVFRKELLLFIIVDLIVADGSNFGRPTLFGDQQPIEIFLLRLKSVTYFLSLFS